jgi:hypothetical protein
MRSLLCIAVLLGTLATAAEAAAPAAPVTAAQFMKRCKDDPEFCKAQIRTESERVEASREACIPKVVSRDDLAQRVLHSVEDILEESPEDFRDFSYRRLAGQIIVFLWPCGVVS